MLPERRMGWAQLDGEPACWARGKAQSPVPEHNGSKALRRIPKAAAGTARRHAGLAVQQAWAECLQEVAAVRMHWQQPMLVSGTEAGREETRSSGTLQPWVGEVVAVGAC